MRTLSVGDPVDDVVAALLDDGYVLVDGMFDDESVAAARADLTRVLESTPTGRNDFEGFSTQRVYALFAKTRTFDAAACHPLLLGVLDAVLHDYQLSAPTGILIGPGEKAQILHRDDSIYPIARPHQQLVVNSMWPLDPFTAENGATRIVPHSHEWNDQRQPDESKATVVAEMEPGSVLLYLGSLWHGGGANQTDTPRLGVILEYVVSWLRAQETHLLAVPPDVVRTLEPRLQELLGYNIHPPFVGYVDGAHPRKVLDRNP